MDFDESHGRTESGVNSKSRRGKSRRHYEKYGGGNDGGF